MHDSEESKNGTLLNKVIGLGFVSLVIYAIAINVWGNKVIGNWFEKPGEWTTQYWVYLEPNNSSTKNYRVRGDIEKLSLGEDGWGYYLRTVYWSNGGYTSFDECQLTTPKGDYCIDTDGTAYTVRLGDSAE